MSQNEFTATYSPEDDKIRIYSARRLTPEEYATDSLKAALRETTDMLVEAHGPELESDHGGDEDCTYCDRIAENEELLK